MSLKFLSLIGFVFCLGCHNNSNQLIHKTNKLIDGVTKQYVIDKRTALFKVEARGAKDKIIIKGETTFPEAKKELTNALTEAGISYLDSLRVLPSPALNGQIYGLVSLSVCNIRSQPKHSAELATQALMGTPLRVHKKDGDFYYIQTPDDYFGWVDDGGLVLMGQTAYQNWSSAERLVCLQDYVFAYEKPNFEATKVTDLLAGNIVSIMEQEGDFQRISLPDGREGYVETDKFMNYDKWLASRTPNAENIINAALEMLGRPYLWGWNLRERDGLQRVHENCIFPERDSIGKGCQFYRSTPASWLILILP